MSTNSMMQFEEDYICIYLQMHPFEKIHCDYMSATWKQSRLTGLTTQELLFWLLTCLCSFFLADSRGGFFQMEAFVSGFKCNLLLKYDILKLKKMESIQL